jgi:hypothetical protein
MTQGATVARWGLKEAWSKCASRWTKPDTRRECRASGQLTAKPISIKYTERRSGDCAQKATEPTPGDLLRVASATENAARHPDRGTEVSRGHIRP